ncbi:MAG: hypothetical protein COX81_03335 [Candidatus Magasanikbacteria bacterium CG_4_10_14_0_2_um_filter_37_12]|uniref:YdbS-like PH domain-containing protein n=1 Tax=Candidatus Magasanikbacteria bacterium CG_4_10_14_0_2_um_filter_37_12 TaxID=1974637 RepID=A0A2M7V741_9BACT|nr:MAG: hypothetical protein COX81_03335 [Candidatus Magasanikbacteria bacterium CG_4_10_14_0_2_um_filter_37_12]
MHLSELINQKSYEKVIYRLRRHPITFIPILFLSLVLLFVPVLVYFLIESLYPTFLQGIVAYPLSILIGSVYFLSMYLFFYVRFLDYYLDVWIVTNDRIVDIEQHGLFSRTTTELDLFRIQDVTVEMRGFFSTIFNYGEIHIKTASINTDIIFKNVRQPNNVREDLVHLSDEDRKYHMGAAINE